MIRQALSFGGLLLLTGAAALATPSLSLAQRGGGHGGGGFHGGGFHGGGFHGGGFHGGGFHGGGFHGGGFHGSGFHGGFHGGGFRFGHPGFGFRHFGGFGYYPYSYGYYPYSYGYDYPYSYGTYPDVGSGLAHDPGYSSPYGYVTPDSAGGTTSVAPPAITSQSLYSPVSAAAPADTLAHVTVKVPADARVWFENTPTTSTGPVRQFDSPPLAPGQRYTYEVRATWSENGQEVTQTQRVGITAGARVEVDFPVKPASAGQAAVTKGH
jgi:uncharacterized protein (TIGR03000 family)